MELDELFEPLEAPDAPEDFDDGVEM